MEKITMNVKELVKAVAVTTGKTQKEISEILTALDSVVCQQLGVADEKNSVEVKVLPSGLYVTAEYVEPHIARNPSTGEDVKVPGKNRVRGKIGAGLKAAAN